uniref:Uncharacterized protein n=1 Tax=Rhizophora mucronata TaxID=61149 RepID=A0A2P2PEI9_RHIMU
MVFSPRTSVSQEETLIYRE